QETINFKAFSYTPKLVNDSLYAALNNATSPEEQLPVLYAIGQEHKLYGSADSVVFYANRIHNILNTKSEFVIPALYQVKANELLGEGKYLNGLYDQALKAFINGLSTPEAIENDTLTKRLKLGLGKIYLQKKLFKKADALFLEATSVKNDNALAAEATLFIGRSLFQQNKLVEAKQTYINAKKLIGGVATSKLNMEIGLAMAELEIKQKNYNSAIPIYESVVTKGLQQNYFDLYTEAVLGYGSASRALGNFEVAEITLSMAYANAMQWNRLDLQKKIINSLRRT
ncbi:unnamed protein product, partial [Ectocarpus sp. 12 AP-2014]